MVDANEFPLVAQSCMHPAVAPATVAGMPDKARGEPAKINVVLKSNAEVYRETRLRDGALGTEYDQKGRLWRVTSGCSRRR